MRRTKLQLFGVNRPEFNLGVARQPLSFTDHWNLPHLIFDARYARSRPVCASVVDVFFSPVELVHDLPLGSSQNVNKQFPLGYVVVSREPFELSLGLDGDDHVEALTLSVDVVEVSLAVGGLALGIALC
jgi:hypothetical protein